MPASRGGFTSRPSGHVSTKAALRAPIAKKSAYTPPSGSTPRVVISTSHSTKEHDARATYGSFRRPSTRSDTKPVSGAEPSSARDEEGEGGRRGEGAHETDGRRHGREKAEASGREPRRGDLEGADERRGGAETHREPCGEQRPWGRREPHRDGPEPHDEPAGGDDAPDAERVDAEPCGDHEAGVRVEVGRRQESDDRGRGVEVVHEVLRDDPRRAPVEERDEEQERRQGPHRPPAARVRHGDEHHRAAETACASGKCIPLSDT